MQTVRISYYGVDGEGRNVTEAKKDAGRKIEAALAGHYTPELLCHRGFAILVYREPSGWCSRLVADPERGVVDGKVWGTNNGSYDEAKRAALSHLADLGWTAADGLEPPSFLTDRRLIADYRTKAEFQLRYQRARALGLKDQDAHSFAGRDPSRPDLLALECA